jgi:hypothetical protein
MAARTVRPVNSTSSTSTTVRPSMLSSSSVGPTSGLGRPLNTSSRYSVMSMAPSVGRRSPPSDSRAIMRSASNAPPVRMPTTYASGPARSTIS